MKTISVFGLGKLGKPLAEFMSLKGFDVIGVDVDINKLSDTEIKTTNDSEYAVKNTDVSIIFVNTPNLKEGAFNLVYVNEVADNIGKALKNKSSYHLIVLRSTVLPGSTERIIIRIESISGKKCGKDFGMIHHPEFLALGTETENIRNPEYILIGEYDKNSGNLYEPICKSIMENNAPIIRTNLINAELAKLMANNYITMKMNFANFIGEICDKIPNTNPDIISDILGHDSRIGRKFLTAGLSYGGTCFPRDNEALSYYLKQLEIDTKFPDVLIEMNDRQIDRIVAKITERMKDIRGNKILVLGTAFKIGTDVVVESASIKIIKKLFCNGFNITVHDPLAIDNTKELLGNSVSYIKKVQKGIKSADLTVLTIPYDEYLKMKYKKNRLIDCWRMVK